MVMLESLMKSSDSEISSSEKSEAIGKVNGIMVFPERVNVR